jgi:hypothetical protein
MLEFNEHKESLLHVTQLICYLRHYSCSLITFMAPTQNELTCKFEYFLSLGCMLFFINLLEYQYE